MMAQSNNDASNNMANHPTINFNAAGDSEEVDVSAIWRMYDDFPPPPPQQQQQLGSDSVNDLDFDMNMSAFTLLMTSLGGNDSEGFLGRRLTFQNGDLFKSVVDCMTLYVTPIIIVIGVVGNALSLAVFSLTYLQRLSSSLYLSMLSVADIVFLLALLVAWLDRVDVSLFTRDGWCQAVLYASRVSGFLAAWHIVVFTAERYVIVHHPLRKDEFCTKRRARVVVAVVVVVAIALYVPTTWTHDVIRFGRLAAVCTPLPSHQRITDVMATVDTILSCLVPSVLIVLLNSRIIHKIRLYQTSAFHLPPTSVNRAVTSAAAAAVARRRRSLVQTSVSASGSMHIKFTSKALPLPPGDDLTAATIPLHRLRQSNLRPTAPGACVRHILQEEDEGQQQQQHPAARLARVQSQFRTARMLLVLSSLTVLLNLPTHVFRVQAVIHNLVGGSVKGARGKFTWQELFELVHFFNFAVNFFVYSCCGRQFRTGLKRLLIRLRLRVKRCWRASSSSCDCSCPSWRRRRYSGVYVGNDV